MFEVTPLTTVDRSDVVLSHEAAEDLASHIVNYVRYETSYYGTVAYHTKCFGYLDLMDGVEFTTFNTKDGKLVKRVSKWLKEAQDIVLTSSELDKLGSIIAHYHPNNFHYDIVDEIDWRAGDFGDSGSCFWGDRSEAKDIIIENGGRALRFFDDNGYGNGRCWVMPHKGNWVVFNAYGPNLQTVESRLNLIYPAAHLKYVSLENYNDTDGTLYINGGRGILVSEVEVVNRNSWGMTIDLEVGEDNMITCSDCNRRCDSDNMYYIDGQDDYVCQRCYERNYFNCDSCERRYRDSYSYNIDTRTKVGSWVRDNITVCDGCLSENYQQCYRCDHYCQIWRDTMTEIDGDDICGYCVKHEYDYCKECETYTLKGDGDGCQCQDAEEEEQSPMPVVGNVEMVSDHGNAFHIQEENVPFFLSLGWTVVQRVAA